MAGKPPRGELTRELFWLTLLCALVEVLVVGICARVSAPQTWLLLCGLAFFTAHAVRLLLQRWLAPVSELCLVANSVLEAPDRRPGPRLDPARFGAFQELAQATDGVLARVQEAHAPHAAAPENELGAERRSQFLRSVSHELRTPLNAILGFADILLSELDGPIDAEQRENLTIVRDSGKRLSRLVDDVLELSALASSDAALAVRARLDVQALLEEVRESLEQALDMRPVHIRIEVAADAQQLVTERGALLMALKVLARHVFEATESGEVLLSATREAGQVLLCVRGESATLAASTLRGLLSAGARAERSLRANALRLSIVQEIALRCGGQLDAQDAGPQLGGFVLRLPAEGA